MAFPPQKRLPWATRFSCSFSIVRFEAPFSATNGCCPGLIVGELEHRPPKIVVVNAAPDGRAVEITGGIEDQTGVGRKPVRAVAEVMQHLRCPAPARGRYELERRSPINPVRAANSSRAVEIAGSIEDQAGSRSTVVQVDAESYQHLLH